MTLVALICPRCGGTVQMDAEIKSGFCVHCGTGIINGQNSKKVVIDKGIDVVNYLKVAKENLMMHEWKAAAGLVESIILTDPDCQDAWFMKALLSMRDSPKYPYMLNKAKEPQLRSRGIFSEEDIMKCWGEYTVTVESINILGRITVMLDEKEPVIIDQKDSDIFGVDPGPHKLTVLHTHYFEGGPVERTAKREFVVSGDCKFGVTRGLAWSLKMHEIE